MGRYWSHLRTLCLREYLTKTELIAKSHYCLMILMSTTKTLHASIPKWLKLQRNCTQPRNTCWFQAVGWLQWKSTVMNQTPYYPWHLSLLKLQENLSVSFQSTIACHLFQWLDFFSCTVRRALGNTILATRRLWWVHQPRAVGCLLSECIWNWNKLHCWGVLPASWDRRELYFHVLLHDADATCCQASLDRATDAESRKIVFCDWNRLPVVHWNMGHSCQRNTPHGGGVLLDWHQSSRLWKKHRATIWWVLWWGYPWWALCWVSARSGTGTMDCARRSFHHVLHDVIVLPRSIPRESSCTMVLGGPNWKATKAVSCIVHVFVLSSVAV